MLEQRLSIVAGMVAVLGLAGCRAGNPEAGFPSPRPLGKTIAAYIPPKSPSDSSVVDVKVEEPAGTLSLRQALALTLMRNPGLASFGWEVRAREAKTLQASLPPNPELTIEVEDLLLKTKRTRAKGRTVTVGPGGVEVERATETEEGPRSGFQGAEYTVALSQVIELGGKRARRTRAAAMDETLAGWDYEAARLDILTEVTKGFVDVVAAQERVVLSQDFVRLAERSLGTVAERVKAGKVSPLEESKARIALATNRIEMQQARRRLEANQKRLAYAWGSLRPCFRKAGGDLFDLPTIPVEDQVLCLISENPDIARWADEMNQRLAAIELARANGIPNVEVSAGYRWIGAENNSALVAGVSSPLPLYDRNQGVIREAKYRYSKALEDRESARIRVRTAVAEAYQELSSAYTEAVGIRQEVLPESQKAFEAATEGFDRGKFGYLDVLDAQRTLFEARRRYIDALATYHKARADVERLIGTPIIGLKVDPAKERK